MPRCLRWAIPLLIAVSCAAYLPYSAYDDVTEGMIRQLQAQESILARQAARGIENLFDNYWLALDSLSKSDHIANLDETGTEWLKTFSNNNNSAVKSITRVDSKGKVLYSFPRTDLQGTDISDQDHIKLISKSHKTVFSDLFKSAQGFQTVAFHVPVFKDGSYAGTLGILVDYDYIAEKYLDDIKIGADGHAWVISQKGIEIYSPHQDHVGKPALENFETSSPVLSLVEEMRKGTEGTYHYKSNDKKINALRYAAYCPVRLYNTFWSICVTAPEAEVLSHIQGFKNRWIAILCFLTAAGIGCSYYFLRFHLLRTEQNIRKEAEGALRKSEERYRRLFEMESDAIMLVDVETGRILDVNPAASELYGYSLEQFRSMRPVDVSAEPEQTAQVIQESVTLVPLRFHKKKDGTIFPVEITGRRSELGGKPVHTAAIRDISDRLEAEKQRKTLEGQLRQAQKLEAVGTLAGGIAHDFNNLLAPIIGYAEMTLLSIPDPNPIRRGLQQILNAGIRASDLVKQILAFSRFTREEEKIPVEIGSVAIEALKLLRSSLPSTIEIRQHIEQGVALADATQIHQVVINLCTNAAQAMSEKGVLDVRLERVNLDASDLAAASSTTDLKPGAYLKLCVADTGCGMDPITLERIFDPYFTTKEVGKGSGLGLAVVHGIVQRHQGAMQVQSEPGKGSVFTLYLPATEATVRTSAGVRPEAPTGTERILLVDDERIVLEMETEILERLGYHVTTASDSELALQTFRAAPDEFDLIITDYTMPNMTGADLVGATRGIRPDIPIVLSTGFNEKMTESTAAELGVEFLLKPFGIKTLADIVRKVLGPNGHAG